MSGFSSQQKFNAAQNKELAAAVHVSAIVKVLSFNPAKMTVNVQPISQRLTAGEYATPSQVLGVPVACTQAGGYLFRPWYQPGDIGIVIYLDHDMDLILQKGSECKPNTERNHSDSDAVFIGGIVTGAATCPQLPAGIALSTQDGNTHIVVNQSGITIKGNVAVQGSVTAQGDVIAGGVSLKTHNH